MVANCRASHCFPLPHQVVFKQNGPIQLYLLHRSFAGIPPLQKLAFHLVSSRSPIVHLTELAAVFRTAATAAHFHARNAVPIGTATTGHIAAARDRCRLEGPASTQVIPTVTRVDGPEVCRAYIVTGEQPIQAEMIEVTAKFLRVGFSILELHFASRKHFLQSWKVLGIRGYCHVFYSFVGPRVPEDQAERVGGSHVALCGGHFQEGNAVLHVAITVAFDDSEPVL
jgi:hypothetical protein